MHHAHAPHEYGKRILLAVTGMSPQVVTETLWALAVAEQDTPFIPTEVHVISTDKGANLVRSLLLYDEPGWFHRLQRDYRLPEIAFSQEHLHVLTDRQGYPMNDIRTPEDNEAAADGITDLVRRFTADPDSALHVSLAGGRKTMGYYLGYALSLYGRPQDRLSHVLVSEGYESSAEFFYPTPYECMIQTGYGKHQKPMDCAQAKIDMAPIPFVRLREELPPRFLRENTQFSAVVTAANRTLEAPCLVLDGTQRKMFADGQEISLGTPQFILYWWMAESTQAGEKAVDWANREAAEDFLRIYRQFVSEFSAGYEEAEEALSERIPPNIHNYFAPHLSRANKSIESVLGNVAARRYKIHRVSPRGEGQLYALDLAPEEIVLR